MEYSYFQWVVTVLLIASVILHFYTDAKRRELNQRYETLIEQEETLIEQKEESYKYMIKIIEELEKHVARKKQQNSVT